MVKLNKVPYEVALDMTGWGRYNYQTFSLCGGVIAAMVFELYSVSYVVPGSACELATSSTQQGLVAGLPLVGVIATSHLWGYLADTHGRRKMLIYSMAIGFVAGSLAALSPNWIMLCVLKFLSSAAVSGTAAFALALLGECTPAKQRSILLLLTTSVFLVCTGVMAVLAIPVLPLTFSYYIPVLDIHFNSWRLLNLIYSFPCLVFCICAVYSQESPKYLLSSGEEEQALEVLKCMFEMNSGKNADLYEVDSIVLDEENLTDTSKGFWNLIVAQTVPMFKPPMLMNTLLLGLLFILVFTCVNPFIMWLPVIADAFMSSVESGATGLSICEMIRLSKNVTKLGIVKVEDCSMNNTAMAMVLCVTLLLAVLNVLAGLMLNCIGKRRLYIFIQMLSGLAAVCINASPLWSLSAVLLLIMMTGSLNFGFLNTFTVDLFPTYVKAKAVGLMLMLGRGFTILGINALVQLIEHDCEAAFYGFAALTIVAGFLGLLLPPDRSFKAQHNAESVESGKT